MKTKIKIKIAKDILKNSGVKTFLNLALNYPSMALTPDKVFSKPLYIQIEPTLKCNLRCKMCYGTYKRRDCKDMDFDDFKKIIDQFPSAATIHLQGLGEPFLHKDIFQMIDYIKSKKKQASLTTNGTLLDEPIVDKILKSGLDFLEFSIDAATAKTYENIRTGANFEDVLSNIRRLTSKIGDKPQLKVLTVVMEENYKELPDLVKLLHNLKISSIYLIRAQGWSEEQGLIGSRNIELDKEIEKYTEEAKVIARKRGIYFDYSKLRKMSSMACKRPWISTSAAVDGYITPCCRVTNPGILNFGNILEKDFNDIWNNAEYKEFRRLAKKHLSVCKNCEFYYRDPMTRENL